MHNRPIDELNKNIVNISHRVVSAFRNKRSSTDEINSILKEIDGIDAALSKAFSDVGCEIEDEDYYDDAYLCNKARDMFNTISKLLSTANSGSLQSLENMSVSNEAADSKADTTYKLIDALLNAIYTYKSKIIRLETTYSYYAIEKSTARFCEIVIKEFSLKNDSTTHDRSAHSVQNSSSIQTQNAIITTTSSSEPKIQTHLSEQKNVSSIQSNVIMSPEEYELYYGGSEDGASLQSNDIMSSEQYSLYYEESGNGGNVNSKSPDMEMKATENANETSIQTDLGNYELSTIAHQMLWRAEEKLSNNYLSSFTGFKRDHVQKAMDIFNQIEPNLAGFNAISKPQPPEPQPRPRL